MTIHIRQQLIAAVQTRVTDPLVHTPYDGRGRREVWVNGKLISNAEYANERKGKVRVVRQPILLDKYGKRVLKRTLYGSVVVKFIRD